MKKKLIRTVALVSAMSMLVGGTVFAASSKMVTKSSSTKKYSESVFAGSTGNTGNYEFKPDTDKRLTGAICEYNAQRYKGDAVGTTEYSAKSTGSFYQTEGNSYKVYLSGGYGYGVVTVQ